MRSSLLSFNMNNAQSAKAAIQNITIMRFYHQLSRIIRYTEMMDKLENKLYQAIDASIDRMSEDSPSTWITLLNIQEKLQKNMIESQKLLQPYLDMDNLSFVQIPDATDSPTDSFGSMLLDQSSRDKVRSSAQAVLDAIASGQVIDSEQEE